MSTITGPSVSYASSISVTVNGKEDRAPYTWKTPFTDSMDFYPPAFDASGEATILLLDNKGNNVCGNGINAYYKRSNLVQRALEMREEESDETQIADLLYHLTNNVSNSSALNNSDIYGTFGRYSLLEGEYTKLREDNGFSHDFVEKMVGQPQIFSVGIASILLEKSGTVTAAPMLRIIPSSKSYYHKFRAKIFDLTRYDFTLGYTANTETNESSDNEAKYFLIGASYQLNNSVFFNLGYAFQEGSKEAGDADQQWYLGATIDANILKELGALDK